MAIQPDHPGLQVCILVDGQPLPEHDESAVHDTMTVTKFVQVSAGSDFAIGYKFLSPFPMTRDIRVRCSLDGTTVRSLCLYKHELRSGNFYTMTGLKLKDGLNWVKQSSRFSNLNIVEADELDSSSADVTTVSKMGNIKIRFNTGRIGNRGGRAANPAYLPVRDSVSELALKGQTQSLGVIGGLRKNSKARVNCDFDIEPIEPIATFMFKYRSLKDLQALGVIPREPSPSPPPQQHIEEPPAKDYGDLLILNRPSTLAPQMQQDTPGPTPVPDSHTARSTPDQLLQRPKPAARAPSILKQEDQAATRDARQPTHRLASPLSPPRAASSQPSSGSTPVHAKAATIPASGPSRDEIMAMIAIYSSNTNDLAGHSTKSLFGLLKYLENKDAEQTAAAQAESTPGAGVGSVKQEHENDGSGEGVQIKRERDDAREDGGGKRRRTEGRKEREVIVLDNCAVDGRDGEETDGFREVKGRDSHCAARRSQA